MKRYALIGSDISRSLSPAIQQHYYNKLGIDADYRLLAISKLNAQTVATLREQNLDGFNVTMPFKVDIIPYLDQLSEAASKINSVNTVICKDGKWIGHNTDYLGFSQTLSNANIELENKTVLLLGSGGSARAIVYALIQAGVKSILIYSRNRATTIELMAEIQQQFDFKDVISVFDTYGLLADLVVNATPLGGSLYPDSTSIDLAKVKCSHFIDINYYPPMTVSMQQAKELGINYRGGLDMLTSQSLHSLILWQELELNQAKIDFLLQGASDAAQA